MFLRHSAFSDGNNLSSSNMSLRWSENIAGGASYKHSTPPECDGDQVSFEGK